MAEKQKLAEYAVKLRIKKGDTVVVLSGKDRGKTGQVLAAFPSKNKVLVEGVNMMTKHQKARQSGRPGRSAAQQIQEGGRIEKPAAMSAAKVMLICPTCNKPTRVGYEFREGEGKPASRKYRVCKHAECAGKSID
jgi:large subunit ribosomal protein L24